MKPAKQSRREYLKSSVTAASGMAKNAKAGEADFSDMHGELNEITIGERQALRNETRSNHFLFSY